MALKFYRCAKCGSMVVKLNAKGCSPSCCGEPMKEMIAGVTDGAREKHVPAVTVDGETVTVQVGSVEHPMMDAHYIQFIALETKSGFQYAELEPGQAPKAVFKAADPVAAYEYCNLHGYWQADI
ncbi:MAG: desulfoferrodoxin Dfx [Lachnospiraceae bacterium]|nr:desulfoferrodoxin Dfx [Lachnospiraceae bacterium]